MTSQTITNAQPESADVGALLARLQDGRTKAVGWITDRIDDSGAPAAADIENAWWRAPWALCVAGAPDAAASMIGWVERTALTEDGDLRPGPYGGDGPGSPVYHLSPIAIASWLLARYDTATTVMDRLATYQNGASGGAFEYRNFRADPLEDTLKTGQLGLSALVTGRRDIADGVKAWLKLNFDEQPDLPDLLYTSRQEGRLVTSFPPEQAFSRVVDFNKPRQAYFHPGIAAAFLAGYSQQARDEEALVLAHKYLALNQGGSNAQFNDEQSVQICKFGWGEAAVHAADPNGQQLPWLIKMAEWFLSRQKNDGSWAPSSFITPQPGVTDYLWKTSEHLMELSYIELALRASAI